MKENNDTEREAKKRVDMASINICLLATGIGVVTGFLFHGVSLFTSRPLPLVLTVPMFTFPPIGVALVFVLDYWFFVLKRRFKNRA